LVRSDASLDSRAFIFKPENVIHFSKTIVDSKDYYDAAKNVSKAVALRIIDGAAKRETPLTKPETKYLQKVISTIDALPASEGEFIDKMLKKIDKTKLNLSEYGL
jgi:hypothetical protein